MRIERRTNESPPRDRLTARPSTETGNVSEIFCSIQGEGLYVGERQLFFRTAGCTATCYWCDTPASKEERSVCVVHGANTRKLPNPLGVDEAVNEINTVVEHSGGVRTVSLTGGEPLEQGEFIGAVARRLKRQGYRIYLETGGLEIEGLRKVRPYASVVAMDIKLPHATGQPHWETHREFLKYLTCTEVFVKVVVDYSSPMEEIVTAMRLLSEVDAKVPLVLQPESSTYLKNARGVEARKAVIEKLFEAQRLGLKLLHDVRIIPQTHKILKVR